MKKIVKICSILLLFLIILIAGCKQNNSSVYTKRDQLFNPITDFRIYNPDEVNIYIDASASMRGFVQSPEYQNLIKNLITSLNSDNITVNYSLFDTTVKPINNIITLFNANLYTGFRANLDLMLKNLNAKHITNSNSLSIVITDFQINNHQIYFDILKEFNILLNDTLLVKFLMKEISFNGLIFPQFINAPPFIYNGNRPLYVIIFSKTGHSEFLTNLINRVFPNTNSLTLAKNYPIGYKLIKDRKIVTVGTQSGKKHHYSFKDHEELKLAFELKCDIFNDWGKLDSNDFEIHSYRYDEKLDTLIKKKNELIVDSLIVDEKGYRIFISNIDNISDRFNIYNITCLPDTFPKWIYDYSTLPNGNQAVKTVLLQQFFEDLTRTVVDKNILFSFNFILEKK